MKPELEKMERQIVESALAWIAAFPSYAPLTPSGEELKKAVIHYREALRPRCRYKVYYDPPGLPNGRECGKLAIQEVKQAPTEEEGRRNTEYRCADHAIIIHPVEEPT
jgi:hypothetical protein